MIRFLAICLFFFTSLAVGWVNPATCFGELSASGKNGTDTSSWVERLPNCENLTRCEQREPNYQLVITTPANEATIWFDGKPVVVAVNVTPVLDVKHGHLLVLFLDGKEVLRSAVGNFSLSNLERGEHHLQLKIIAQNNQVLAESATTIFYFHQRSIGM